VLIGIMASTLAVDSLAADSVADDTTTVAPPVIAEVVITGSRIPVAANLTSTSPIQAISSQEIQLQGYTDVTDVINTLPQNFINAAVDFGNHSNPLAETGGIATADLRGLGPQRTLVLVDGRRLGVGDPSTSNPNPAPDLDQIPAALIERVDVVTGGASATYGSDALAGVVNFIMKKNFQGVEVDGSYDFFQHDNRQGAIQNLESISGIVPPSGHVHDGGTRDLSIIVGSNLNDNAGNVTAYFTYHNASPVNGTARDFADCLLASTSASSWDCGNSSNSNKFTVAGTGTRYTVLGNEFLPWPQAGSNPPANFNSYAYEYLQREDQRYNAGAFAHLDLSEAVRPYLELSFMNDRTAEIVGPSAIFSGGNTLTPDGNYLVNCSNPLLSAQQLRLLQSQGACTGSAMQIAIENADLDIGRRNVEGGGRLSYYEHNNFRIVAGAGGALGSAWNYDAYAQYYYTAAYTDNEHQLGVQAVNNALQVTGTAANPVCISGPPCVPYNIFSTGAVTAAQLNYLYTPGTTYGTDTEEIAHADLTGDLGKYGLVSPWAVDGVRVNLGVEHRLEAVSFSPDETELQGNLEGEGALLPIAASYSVSEAFLEARVALAQGKPGVHDLSVDAGYRYSDYTTSAGVTNTYKFEVQYAPIQDLRLRFSYDRAVRAPNLIDLYNPLSYGQEQTVATDPCAPTLTAAGAVIPATASLAACERTGVTAAEYGNGGTTNSITQCTGGQCGQVLGGNPKLVPESADTWSLGVTLTPIDLPHFTATVDYWHIALANVIGTIPANILLDGCLNNTNPAYCADIKRTVDGSLTGASVAGGGWILQSSVNTAAELVSGIDVQVNYQLPLPGGWGHLSTALNGTWLQHTTTTPYAGAHTYDCAGLFGVTCGNGVNPTWRHNLRLSWETPWRILLSAQWRYIGGTGFDNNSPDPSLHFNEEGVYDIINARIPGYSYADLSAIWHFWKGLELRAGVNNVFDKDPPILPSGDPISQAANTYPTYDILGRNLFVAVSAKF